MFLTALLSRLYSDEKLVITHYMNETVKNIVALDAKKALPNPWVEHHLPVALCSPRGTSLACDALQLSLLAVGSVHLRYLTRETGPAKTEFAQNVRGRVFAMLRKSIDTSTSDEDTETILAALLSCMIASVSRRRRGGTWANANGSDRASPGTTHGKKSSVSLPLWYWTSDVVASNTFWTALHPGLASRRQGWSLSN